MVPVAPDLKLCNCREVYLPPKFGVSQSNYSVPADGTAHLHCPVQVEDNIPLSFPLVIFTPEIDQQTHDLLIGVASVDDPFTNVHTKSNIIVKLPTYSGYQICARRNGFLFFKLGKQMLLLSLPPTAVYTGDLFHCSKQNLYVHLEQLSSA